MVMDITGRPTGMSRLHRDFTPMLSCDYVCCVGATEFGGSVQESCNRRWRLDLALGFSGRHTSQTTLSSHFHLASDFRCTVNTKRDYGATYTWVHLSFLYNIAIIDNSYDLSAHYRGNSHSQAEKIGTIEMILLL